MRLTMRPSYLRGFAAAAGALAAAAALRAQPPDAAEVLARMQKALGGDALAAVQAFSVEGTEELPIRNLRVRTRIEWVYVRPDRFIEVQTVSGRSFEQTTVSGFNGDRLVRLRDAGGVAARVRRPDPPPLTPATHASAVTGNKRKFSRLAIAMLGVVSAYPYEVSYAGRETLEKATAHVLALKAADGYEARLFVDEATHLPAMIAWKDAAGSGTGADRGVVRIDGSTGVLTGADGTPLPPGGLVLAAGDGAPDAERRLLFTDYKRAGGLTWPHRIREVLAGRTAREFRLGKFRINPEIDPRRFVTVPLDWR
jgi:hypothetical protein